LTLDVPEQALLDPSDPRAQEQAALALARLVLLARSWLRLGCPDDFEEWVVEVYPDEIASLEYLETIFCDMDELDRCALRMDDEEEREMWRDLFARAAQDTKLRMRDALAGCRSALRTAPRARTPHRQVRRHVCGSRAPPDDPDDPEPARGRRLAEPARRAA
jgi:hypothetical protein